MDIFKTETAKSKQQNKDETIEAKNQKERIYNEEGNEWVKKLRVQLRKNPNHYTENTCIWHSYGVLYIIVKVLPFIGNYLTAKSD